LRTALICFALGVLCGLTSSPASAAPRQNASPQKRAAAASFRHGKALYADGDYAGALAAFQAGYDAYPLQGFLVNIGQCQRRLGHLAEAEAAFRHYLDSDEAPASLRMEVQDALDEVVAAERKAAPPPVVVEPPPPVVVVAPPPPEPPPVIVATAPPEHPKTKRWKWALLGVGLGVVAAGAAVGIVFGLRRAEPSASLGVIDARNP
jgi:hypothetical protein